MFIETLSVLVHLPTSLARVADAGLGQGLVLGGSSVSAPVPSMMRLISAGSAPEQFFVLSHLPIRYAV